MTAASSHRAATVPADRWTAASCCSRLYYVMAVSAAAQKSMTFDEMAHLTGGYSYWALDDYRLHPENGNCPQRLGGTAGGVQRRDVSPADAARVDEIRRLRARRPVSVLERQQCRHTAAARARGDRDPWRRPRRVRVRVDETTRVAGRRMGESRAVRVLADAAGARRAGNVGHGGGLVLHRGDRRDVGRAPSRDATDGAWRRGARGGRVSLEVVRRRSWCLSRW